MRRRRMVLVLLVLSAVALVQLGRCAASRGTTSAQWTLYPGLYLSWNAASQFCREQSYGHLATTHTRLTWAGIEKVIAQWETRGHYLGEFWLGLYAKGPLQLPELWEGDCSVQPPSVHRWSGITADIHGGHKMCVTGSIQSDQLKWRTRRCDANFAVICQTSQGNCTFDTHPSNSSTGATATHSLSFPLNSSVSQTTPTDLQACSSQCLDAQLFDEECVAVEYNSSNSCRLYFGSALLSSQEVLLGAAAEDTWLRHCFTESVSVTEVSTVLQNTGSSLPEPACPCDATWSTQLSCQTNAVDDHSDDTVHWNASTTTEKARDTSADDRTSADVQTTIAATSSAQSDISTAGPVESETTTQQTTANLQLNTERRITNEDLNLRCPCKAYTCTPRNTPPPSQFLLTVIPRKSTLKYRQRQHTTWREGTVTQVFLTVFAVSICCLFIAAIVVADVRLMIHDFMTRPTRKALTPSQSKMRSKRLLRED